MKKTYHFKGEAKVLFHTSIVADSLEEAEEIASDRGISLSAVAKETKSWVWNDILGDIEEVEFVEMVD